MDLKPISYFNLNDEQRLVVKYWEQQLPPVIARKEVSWFLGGIVSRASLRDHDCKVTGPIEPIQIGKCVAYHTRYLLAWLIQSRGLTRLQKISNLIQGKARSLTQEQANGRQRFYGTKVQDGHSA